MNHAAAIQHALDYLEQNLREEIRVDDIAHAANFSTSHFHAIFQRATGCTVAEHLRKRRLSCAALDLALSRRSILDIAVEYRFDSQEAFTRAFKRLYGITPGLFRRNRAGARVSPRLGIYNPSTLTRHEPVPNPFASTERAPGRLLLTGVPKVGFDQAAPDQCPETVPFPSCLAAALRYLGEEYPWLPLEAHNRLWRLNYANVHLLGATGMAFGLLWRPGWHRDNVDMLFIADPRLIIDRAFCATGYSYEIIEKTGNVDSDERIYRERVREALEQGRPVLAFGVVGPPECCLITGYDDHGATVIGWSYFADQPPFNREVEFERSGQFRKRDWVRTTRSLVLLGAPTEQRFNLRETLEWALHVAETPTVMGRHAGLAAYDAWAEQLLDDSAFPLRDEAVLAQRHQVHYVESLNLAECRAWAGQFLRHQAQAFPRVSAALLEAADCYSAEHDLVWQMWELAGEHDPAHAHVRFASPEIRRRTAALIRKARELDERATGCMKRAISILAAH